MKIPAKHLSSNYSVAVGGVLASFCRLIQTQSDAFMRFIYGVLDEFQSKFKSC